MGLIARLKARYNMNGNTRYAKHHRPRTLAILGVLLGLSLPIFPALAAEPVRLSQLQRVPTVPPLPQPLPAAYTPIETGIVDLTDLPVGLGYLRPEPLNTSDTPPPSAAGWLSEMALPLYASPDGPLWGWLIRGWLIPDGQPALAVGRDARFAMVRIEPDLLAFPVMELREDGWFRVQYTEQGSAWAHISHLTFSDRNLTIQRWSDYLTSSDALTFRQPDEAQVLRSQPKRERNVISLISADSLIAPLEVSGDWVRVRVTRPVDGCRPLTGATTEEGWMRWRSEAGEVILWGSSETCR
jgi:hypothetical protein